MISNMVRSLLHYSRNRTYKVTAIGACIPGIYNPVKKTVWAPNIQGWNHIPLLEELKNRLEIPQIKLIIESDRSCYILGEIWKGAAKGCTDAIFIAVGTGIGAGILSNGRIINGNSGIAGAIGWMAMEPPYLNKYDSCGNFEYYASGDGIARSAVETLRIKKASHSTLASIPCDQLTAHHVFDAYTKKDPVATEVIEKAIRHWGMSVANLVSIFNPQKIIFGGGLFGPASQFLDRILEEAKKWAQPLSIQEVQLETSILQGNAGLIGAGYLAISNIKDKVNVK
jgi:glucokinase